MIKKGDVLVLMLAAGLVGMSYGAFWTARSEGRVAVISVNHRIVEQISITAPDDLDVEGVIGTSRLRVREGGIRFIDSPCPGRYCVHTGWLTSTGQVAACLPNGVVVEVLGGERVYDAINL